MHPVEWPYPPVPEIVALAEAEEVEDVEVGEETDMRSTHAHTVKWTIISPKRAEQDCTLNAIQIPPGMTSGHATTAVTQDTAKPTPSTSNMPGINATWSKKAQHLPCSLQQEIVT